MDNNKLINTIIKANDWYDKLCPPHYFHSLDKWLVDNWALFPVAYTGFLIGYSLKHYLC